MWGKSHIPVSIQHSIFKPIVRIHIETLDLIELYVGGRPRKVIRQLLFHGPRFHQLSHHREGQLRRWYVGVFRKMAPEVSSSRMLKFLRAILGSLESCYPAKKVSG